MQVQISGTNHYIIIPLIFILKCHVRIGRTKMDSIAPRDYLNIFRPIPCIVDGDIVEECWSVHTMPKLETASVAQWLACSPRVR